jgi:hypothetical protein
LRLSTTRARGRLLITLCKTLCITWWQPGGVVGMKEGEKKKGFAHPDPESGSESLRSFITQRPDVSPTMLMRNGRTFDLIHPDRSVFDITDIAWGLARECRFGNQVRDDLFYSVAQHSLWIAARVPDSLAWQALMHDAHEFVLCDLPKPIKLLCPDYSVLEKRVERAVLDRAGITSIAPLVKHMDLVALATEQRDLMRRLDAEQLWDIERLGITPDARRIEPLEYRDAAAQFIEFAHWLVRRNLVPTAALEPLFDIRAAA